MSDVTRAIAAAGPPWPTLDLMNKRLGGRREK